MRKIAENTPMDISFGDYYERLRRENKLINPSAMFSDALIGFKEAYKNELYNKYRAAGLPEEQAIKEAELDTLERFHAPLPIDDADKKTLGVNTLSEFLYKKYGANDHRDIMPTVRENFLVRKGDEDRANMATAASRNYARIHGKPLPNPWAFNIGKSLGTELLQGVPIAWLPSWGYSALQAIKSGRIGKFFEDRERQNNELEAPYYTASALPDLNDIDGSSKRMRYFNTANTVGSFIGSALSWPIQTLGWGPGISAPARALGLIKAAKPVTAPAAAAVKPGFLKRYTGMGKWEWGLYGLPGIGRFFRQQEQNNKQRTRAVTNFDQVSDVPGPKDSAARLKLYNDRAMEDDIRRRAQNTVNPVTGLPSTAPSSIPRNTYLGEYNHVMNLYRDDEDPSKPHPNAGPLFRQYAHKGVVERELANLKRKVESVPYKTYADYVNHVRSNNRVRPAMPGAAAVDGPSRKAMVQYWNQVMRDRANLKRLSKEISSVDREGNVMVPGHLGKPGGFLPKGPMTQEDFDASKDRFNKYLSEAKVPEYR